jgi:hypothetical protein
MPETRLKLPDLSQPHKYERPSHLPKRLTPPPERAEPPDLTLFLYAGIVLALVLVVLAIPYLMAYLFEVVRF